MARCDEDRGHCYWSVRAYLVAMCSHSDVSCDISSYAEYDGCVSFHLSLSKRDTELRARSARLAPHDPADYPNIKVVATAGEPCPLRTSHATGANSPATDRLAALAEKWGKAAHYYNSCGPTEVCLSRRIWLFAPLIIGNEHRSPSSTPCACTPPAPSFRSVHRCPTPTSMCLMRT